MRNPALMPWRSAAALSLAALGRAADARQLCAEELRLARSWARADLGSALRRSGPDPGQEPLRQALDLAHANGGLALAERARSELIIAGGRPRRQAIRGRDALTQASCGSRRWPQKARLTANRPGPLRYQRTVEAHLTSEFVADAVAVPDQAAYRLPRWVITSRRRTIRPMLSCTGSSPGRAAAASRRTPQPFDRSR